MGRLTSCGVAAWLLMAAAASAHHGTGISYDNATLFTSSATVTAFEYKNPHVRIFFDTKDEQGHVKHWSGEMANPGQYERAGWPKKRTVDELMPGTVITISYWISKAEENLPPEVGAALVVRIRNAKNERVLLDRQ